MRGSGRSSRIRIFVAIAVGLLLVLFLSASGVARLYTDWLWFDSLERGSVWTTIVGTQFTLAVGFSVIFFMILWVNLYLADRFAPSMRPESPEEDLIERYHQIVGSHVGKIRVGISALFALVAGGNTAAQWQTWLLFINGGDFGRTDPLFNKDAGFYIFRLPFWTFLVDWFFSALVFALILSLIAHYLNGGIRATVPSNRVTSGVKLHLSILLAVLAVLRAVAYWLDRFHLVNSNRGLYDGALSTDVQVQLPALKLLVVISLFGAVLVLFNIRREGWVLPVVALGLWAVSHVVVATIYPSLYQRLRVEVEQSSREEPFIARNIEATRFAYGLDEGNLIEVDLPYEPALTVAQLEANADVFEDISILDPQLAADAFNRSEGGRELYQFSEPLDVDRYMVDGELEPVTIGVRSLNLARVDSDWEKQHIVNTHGYGVAMASSDATSGGLPDYVVSGIGPDEQRIAEGFAIDLTQPQVYFDEDFSGYAIVGASRDEVDYVAGESVNYRYDGTAGVPMSGLVRRTAFALRFQQYEVLISPFIQSGSRVIYNRDVGERVRELAPFLSFDSDPYPIVANGQIYWIVDAYTTTSEFPYSQGVSVRSNQGSDLSGGFNYVRNSVKAVVDAYNGDVSFYVIDEDDPIVAAWAKTFPDLFQSIDEVPQSIEEHFRYPTDIFNVQTETWDTYQVASPIRFLEGAQAWRVTSQPFQAGGDEDSPAAATVLMTPQYRTTRLPNEDQSSFVLQRGFVPSSGDASTGRPELTAIMVAPSDPERYGTLIQYRLPAGRLSAPDLIDSDIRRDDIISPFISLRNREGSTLEFGQMQMVLVENTVVYVRPLYIKADTTTAVPELNRVIAVNGGRIAMAETLEEALRGITVDGAGTTRPPPEPQPSSPENGEEESPVPEVGDLADLTVAELVARVETLLDAANLVEASEPETAEELRAEALAALEALSDILGVPDSPPTTEAAGA